VKDWIAAQAELSTAVVLDALDEFGHRRQAILDIPPRTTGAVIIGRAKTMLWVDFAYDDPNTYALELEAVDSIRRRTRTAPASGASS
jgi:hypothetical protein